MKNILVIILLSVFVGSLSGALTTICVLKHDRRSVSTEELVVVDRSGRPRATLGVSPQQTVSLKLLAPDQTELLSLAVETNPASRPEIPPGLREDSEPWEPIVQLNDSSGRRSSILTTVGQGNANLAFFGADGGAHARVGYIGDGGDVVGKGAWGLRATKGDFENSIGILDYTSANGEKFLSPSLEDTRASIRAPQKGARAH